MKNKKAKELIGKLENIQSELRQLREEVYLEVDDLSDNQLIEEKSEILKEYNISLKAFKKAAKDLAAIIEDAFEQTTSGKSSDAKQLDISTPHSLEEDFTYKSPYGFRLQEEEYLELRTWKSIYEKLLDLLKNRDPDLFVKLTEADNLRSKRGNKYFTRDREGLNKSLKIADSIFAEVNLSANQITKRIQGVLIHFGFDPEDMVIYLRENRQNR